MNAVTPWTLADAEAFGVVLTRLRKARGLSQRRLAAFAQLSGTTVAVLESGQKSGRAGAIRPTADTLQKLAVGLSTDLVDERTVDTARAERVFADLLRAAKYGPVGEPEAADRQPETARTSIDDLTDAEVERRLTEYTGQAEAGAAFAGSARNWRRYPPSAQRLILAVLEDAEQRANERDAGR